MTPGPAFLGHHERMIRKFHPLHAVTALAWTFAVGCGSSNSSTSQSQSDSGADGSGEDSSAPMDSSTGHDSATEAAVDSGVMDTGTPVDSSTGMEASTGDGGGDAGPCATTPATDFYVDATNGSDTNKGGSPTCAFKTITAALTASAPAAHNNAIIHVAAGAYGAGETFPLIVNHGRSLVGAGPSTVITGSSTALYKTTGTGSFLDLGRFLTVLAGDAMGGAGNLGATTISGVKLLPAATITTPTANYLGLACLAGNAPNTGSTPPLPTPSLIVKNVSVGPNYDVGMAIGSQPTQSIACNALITQSAFSGSNIGLETGACGTTNPVTSWPSAQVGDGVPSDANVFGGSVADAVGGGCGSVQSYNGNDFVSGWRGLVIISQSAQYFEILGNTFTGSAGTMPMGMGLQTSSSTIINKLNGNTFTNISESAGADTAAGQTTGYAVTVANVLQARGNLIANNDNGVYIGVAPLATFDFSSDGTASNANQIFCNSKPSGGTTNGYDVTLAYTGGTPLNFAGNAWDHATLTTGVSTTTSANGTDLVTGTSLGATTTGSTAMSASCSGGRVK